MPELPSFGQWVRHQRKDWGWTQEELGALVGYSVHMIRKIEADLTYPAPEGLAQFGAVFQCAAADFAASVQAWNAERDTQRGPGAAAGVDISDIGPLLALPAWSTPLLGREAPLATLVRLLTTTPGRLVTVTGAGGVGKTHLAVQAAHQLAAAFPAGCWFVDLADTPDLAALLPQLTELTRQAYTTTRAEADRDGPPPLPEALLVLDTGDQVPDLSVQIARLRAAVPRLTLLVTSRRPLGLYEEQLLPLAPLPLPPPDTSLAEIAASPAIQLFVERARTVNPDIVLTPATAPILAAICARLDGLPLALELAALRLRSLDPATLLTYLAAPLPLLREDTSARPARQQSLGTSLAYSYALLTPREEALLHHLALDPAGCLLAELLAAPPPGLTVDDIFPLLDALVVQQWAVPAGDTPETAAFRVPGLARAYLRGQPLAPLAAGPLVYLLPPGGSPRRSVPLRVLPGTAASPRPRPVRAARPRPVPAAHRAARREPGALSVPFQTPGQGRGPPRVLPTLLPAA